METALALTDEFAPLNLVSVVRLSEGPAPEVLHQALAALHARYPLLRASIGAAGSRRFFRLAGNGPVALALVERHSEDSWQPLVEAELNERLPARTGPLLRCAYLSAAAPGQPCEIVLSAHHTIADASSALVLLDELLWLCAASAPASGPAAVPPAADALFPPSQRGLAGAARVLAFAGRQMAGEVAFRWQARRAPPPPIHLDARCRIVPLRVPAGLTSALFRACRARRVTLTAALSAALLLAVHRRRYAAAPTTLRGLVFGDLRPYLKPPPPRNDLGGYVTMMPYDTALRRQPDFWRVAGDISGRVYRAASRGDKFAANRLSPLLVGIITRLKSMRLAAAALSYSGLAELPAAYGSMRVLGLHGFVSNNALGAEFTAATRLFRDELWCDCVYLDSDFDRPAAAQVAGDVLQQLEQAVR
jgi:hypothetical protein